MIVVAETDVLDADRCEWRSLGNAATDVCLGIMRRRQAGHAFLMLLDPTNDSASIPVEETADLFD